MKIGMMWLDTDKQRTLDEKVKRAAEYYRDKYGRLPEVCLVNERLLEDEKKVGRVLVQPAKAILPSHFWLGMTAAS
jgi:hypothetical protein